MATLAKLQEQRRELEDRLAAGDPAAEPLLERIDAAIAARTLKIQHSRKRLAVAKDAVQAGLPADEARRLHDAGEARRLAERRAKRPLNRF